MLSSCNTTKIFYNYGEIFISWQVDNYFDLTSEQEEWLKEKSILLLDWHRKEELPGYKKFLIEIKEIASGGLDMNDLDYSFSIFETKRDRIFEKITPDIATFLDSLSVEQINFLEKKMLEDNEELYERMKDKEVILEKRKENFFEQMETWFGEISKNQVARLDELQNQWYKKSSHLSKNRLDLRLKSQNQFITFLRSKPGKTSIENWLRQWTFRIVNSSDRKRVNRILRNKKRILEVDKILTHDQRIHAIKELDIWIKVIEETIENY